MNDDDRILYPESLITHLITYILMQSLHALVPALHDYRSLELEAHVGTDDVLSKIVQEMGELIESIHLNDRENIEKEAKDLLINILSLGARIWIYPDGKWTIGISIPEIPLHVARLHSLIAASRKRYSRDALPSREQIHEIFQPLIVLLLELSGEPDHSSVVDSSSLKFKSRIAKYLPDIDLKDFIASHPDFPKPGILFRDISPLLAHPESLRYAGFELARHAQDADVIAGLDARGFIFGTLVAQILEKPFVMIRKKGKLPWKTIGTQYSLEYGDNSIEIQNDAIKPGQKVVIIDDLLATGGTMQAAAHLVESVGGLVDAILCLIALDEPFLANHSARKSLEAKYRVKSILHYD